MVFTIEPGIYLENEFGIRIEDVVLLTKDGVESLVNASKDIIIIE
jgi:Xaa-Pro dipeptidase